MEFTFGIPPQRGKAAASAANLYPYGAAIIVVKNNGPRTSKEIVLNQDMCDNLNLEDGGQIAFDFTKETPVVVNATGMELPKGQGYIVKAKKDYQGLTFKDSKLWGYFVKTYNLDETADNSFEAGAAVSHDPVAFMFDLATISQADEEVITMTTTVEYENEPMPVNVGYISDDNETSTFN